MATKITEKKSFCIARRKLVKPMFLIFIKANSQRFWVVNVTKYHWDITLEWESCCFEDGMPFIRKQASEKGIRPKRLSNVVVKHDSSGYFQNMSILPFCDTILLQGIKTRSLIHSGNI